MATSRRILGASTVDPVVGEPVEELASRQTGGIDIAAVAPDTINIRFVRDWHNNGRIEYEKGTERDVGDVLGQKFIRIGVAVRA